MAINELQNRLLDNVVSLARENRNEYENRKNSNSILVRNARAFYVLNCILLNPLTTTDTLYPLYELYENRDESELKETYGNEKYDEKRKSFEMVISRLSKDTVRRNRYVDAHTRGYKGRANAYSLTRDGLDFILANKECYSAVKGYTEMTGEEYQELFSYSIKKSAFDHSIDTFGILTETVSKGRYKLIKPVEKEVRKDAGFVTSYVQRSASPDDYSIYPDVAFSYYSDNKYRDRATVPVQPVIVEVDLDTERVRSGGTSVGVKALDHLFYADKISSTAGGTMPPSVVFVAGENAAQVNNWKKNKVDVGQKCSEAEIAFVRNSRYTKFVSSMIQTLGKNKDETIYIDELCEEYERWLIERNAYVDDGANGSLEITKRLCKMYYEGLAVSSGMRLTLEDSADLLKAVCREKEIVYLRNLERRQSEKTMRKGGQIVNYLDAHTAEHNYWFSHGVSLALVPYYDYGNAMKSLHPFAFGMKQIKSLLWLLGLKEKAERFYPVYPLLRGAQYDYYLNLRNCFVSDGVKIFIEDISYDLSALRRIRDYITMPSDLCKNCILFIVINDDETIAGGRELKYLSYTKGVTNDDDDNGKTFEEAFFECYGGADEKESFAPFGYDKTHDFCFIKRSEFVSADALSLSPFIRFGGHVIMRKGKQIEDTIHYREGQMYHGSRIETGEFRAYDVKGDVERA